MQLIIRVDDIQVGDHHCCCFQLILAVVLSIGICEISKCFYELASISNKNCSFVSAHEATYIHRMCNFKVFHSRIQIHLCISFARAIGSVFLMALPSSINSCLAVARSHWLLDAIVGISLT